MELPFGRNRAAAEAALAALDLSADARRLLDWLFARAWPDFADGKPAGPQPVAVKRSEMPIAVGLSQRRTLSALDELLGLRALRKTRQSRALLLTIDWRTIYGLPPIAGADAGQSPARRATQPGTRAAQSPSLVRRLVERVQRLLQAQQLIAEQVEEVAAELREVLDQPAAELRDQAHDHSDRSRETSDRSPLIDHSQNDDVDVVLVNVFEDKELNTQQHHHQSVQVLDQPRDQVIEHSDRSPETSDRSPPRRWQEHIPSDRRIIKSYDYCETLYQRLQRQGWIGIEDRRKWFAFWAWLCEQPDHVNVGGIVCNRVRDGTWRDVDERWDSKGDAALAWIAQKTGSHGATETQRENHETRDDYA